MPPPCPHQAKTVSSGYASFDYSTADPEPADLVKVDISINGDSVDALSFVCHRDAAQRKGRDVAKRLKEVRRVQCCKSGELLYSGECKERRRQSRSETYVCVRTCVCVLVISASPARNGGQMTNTLFSAITKTITFFLLAGVMSFSVTEESAPAADNWKYLSFWRTLRISLLSLCPPPPSLTRRAPNGA